MKKVILANQYRKRTGCFVAETVTLAKAFSAVPIICLCAYFGETVELVKKTANVSVNLSFIEKFRTLPTLLDKIPAGRVLFGSHTPFLYTTPAVMKLKAIRRMPGEYQAVACANAMRLFGSKPAGSRAT